MVMVFIDGRGDRKCRHGRVNIEDVESINIDDDAIKKEDKDNKERFG